jgi:hypothetical protein
MRVVAGAGMSAGHHVCQHMETTGLAIINVAYPGKRARDVWPQAEPRHHALALPLSGQRREAAFPTL